jgi:uncharacterized protein YigE (DUF2233 family)
MVLQAPGAWVRLGDGLERRTLPARPAEGIGLLLVYRIAPGRYSFDVGYSPGEPKTLAEWQRDSGADIVVNGGYFDEHFRTTGLLVTAGEVHGRSYEGFGGVFAIAANGEPSIVGLADQPWPMATMPVAAVSSFPMLVVDGAPTDLEESELRSRRTVVATDEAGNVLVIIAADGRFTLAGLARHLAASDLGIDMALNLDGGSSTGLLVADPPDGVPALGPLPAVLLLRARAP